MALEVTFDPRAKRADVLFNKSLEIRAFPMSSQGVDNSISKKAGKINASQPFLKSLCAR